MLPKITRIIPKTVKVVPASSHFVTFSSLFRNRCAKNRVTRGLVDATGVTVTTLDIDKAVNKLITPVADASPHSTMKNIPDPDERMACPACLPPIGANNIIPKNIAAAATNRGEP